MMMIIIDCVSHKQTHTSVSLYYNNYYIGLEKLKHKLSFKTIQVIFFTQLIERDDMFNDNDNCNLKLILHNSNRQTDR